MLGNSAALRTVPAQVRGPVRGTRAATPFFRACPKPARTATLAARHIIMAAVQGSKIVVDRSPLEAKLKEMRSCPTWGCDVSEFPWSYDSNETCYVLEGEVIVTPDGGEPVLIKAGDMATFPAGMSCTWDVKRPIKKHYKFH